MATLVAARLKWLDWLPCALLAAVLAAWLLAAMLSSRVHLVLLDPGNVYAERRFVGAGVFAGALTVLAVSRAALAPRLRWLALGLTCLALGSVLFGDLLPRSIDDFSIATGLYGLLLTRGMMVGLTAVGLLLSDPPALSLSLATLITGIFLLLAGAVTRFAGSLPSLVTFDTMPPEPANGVTEGFTALYWIAVCTLVALATTVAVVTIRRHRSWGLGLWLPLAAVLLAGNLTHVAFRPSLYGISTELTTSTVLMSALILWILLGATFDVRRIADLIAADRDALAEETRRLVDLARLRADFTAMVAHELAQPLVAIRRAADVLQLHDLEPSQRTGIEAISTEATTLFAMLDDVRASAAAESEDFSMHPEEVDIDRLLDRAAAFGATLPDGHLLQMERSERGAGGSVWADPERIDQVLRNLLVNAARYSPAQTTVTLRAIPVSPEITRIEVEDEGPGIDPEELERIFEKYQRGRSDEPGLGLGLYLSRRILRASGGELHYRNGAGGGCFWFDLPRVSRRAPGNNAPGR